MYKEPGCAQFVACIVEELKPQKSTFHEEAVAKVIVLGILYLYCRAEEREKHSHNSGCR